MRRAMSVFVLGLLCCLPAITHAQAPTAVVNGQVRDTSGAAIPKATVVVINDATNVRYTTETNDEGIYSVPNLPPGTYRIQVSKQGFKTIVHPDIVLHVQDAEAIGFTLPVGPSSDTVTVEGGAPLINTESAAVSTVVDRQFADNLPMNGRSFQTLIYLTPGVVVVPSNGSDAGQFAINGQRAASNYWTLDGVSANIGISSANFTGDTFGGALGAFSAQGGTNSLVSVDALQEFRIQTSTYAPEFGRTPGGQISIVTRSGANQFHGSVFDYLRNDVLDANDWFANYNHLTKPEERQNDFGGTFSGPVVKNRTFFFFSYEGLRLRLPQVAQTTVPDASFTPGGTTNSRQIAAPAIQPFFNAYPLPNPSSPEIYAPCTPNVNGCPASGQKPTGSAAFNASFSNPSTLDAYSLRVDHKLSSRITLFGRYNYSPSELTGRGHAVAPLSELSSSRIVYHTGTLGTTWTILPMIVNDFRFNYSRVSGSSRNFLDNFGGAASLSSLPLPSPYTEQNSEFGFFISSLRHGNILPGRNAANLQRQINIVDTLSFEKGSHALKFGVDFRRLSPMVSPPLYIQANIFGGVTAAENGTTVESIIQAQSAVTLLLRNLGAFAQDTWRVVPGLTLTYGLRWDLDVAPESLNGPSIVAVTGYNLNDFSRLAIAPAGTPPFRTPYGDVAPRIGLAYQLRQNPGRETVLRGGFGVFYDLIGSTVGTSVFGANPPFGAVNMVPGAAGAFPLNSSNSAPPKIPSAGDVSELYAFNPNLKSPYTLEWSFALEQALGAQQTISASYVGATGRRLLQTPTVQSPPSNMNVGSVLLAKFVDNLGSSSYDALQLQFQRRMSHGLQILASYAWAHSIDTGSAGSPQLTSNEGAPSGAGSFNTNRGPSDFDVRHAFSTGLTYAIPRPASGKLAKAFLGGWSLQSTILARSAPPVDIFDEDFFSVFNSGFLADIRPDVVAGQPFYLFGANCASVMQSLGNLAAGQGCPGGKGLNPNAFTDPPDSPPGCIQTGAIPCNPARQGNLGRNGLRGFGATQWDFAVHRDFAIRESLKLQFRAEMFNVLNHANFGQPDGFLLSPAFGGLAGFGLSTSTLAHYLDGGGAASNVGGGAFNPLYQIGGPRSIQFGLKLSF